MLNVLLAGLGGMVVMASGPSPAFTAGLLLVRLAMVLMHVNLYFQLHEARKALWIEILLSGSSSHVLLSSFILPHFMTCFHDV